MVAPQGTVLRRIQKLHSPQEEGAAGLMREVSGAPDELRSRIAFFR